jgi:hypothetical protein
MRIQKTESRERLWSHLREATGRGHTSAALDDAARYYLRMRGGTGAHPRGVVELVMREAERRGSLTAGELAELLSVDELGVTYRSELTVTSSAGVDGSPDPLVESDGGSDE